MNSSGLTETLASLSSKAASAVVARARAASPGLNAALLRRLSAAPGEPESFLADPVFEFAKSWEPANQTFGELAGGLLRPELVAALDGAGKERLARDQRPYSHQIEAWRAGEMGKSYIVTSGTGSGKTECFLVPILNDLLRRPEPGRLAGVRAIVIYPLNALIESQRERLAAWTTPLARRLSFALYNSLTPETPRKVDKSRLAAAEIGDRQSLRVSPPSILVTNVTMLEYLLLRSRDKDLLAASRGLLRWIVLDEAHSYVGAQAAEMALLLRRVRSAFGVGPEATRLVATSATISEGEGTREKLARFVADLGGVGAERVQVIEGRPSSPVLPKAGRDETFEASRLTTLDAAQLWNQLAPHPRLQALQKAMWRGGVTSRRASELLLGRSDLLALRSTQDLLDWAAQARENEASRPLLPWRAHIFHRPLSGLWACVDPACPRRDSELCAEGAAWPFGAISFSAEPACGCGAPVHALRLCDNCGAPHLAATMSLGALPKLSLLRADDTDDFAVDDEPVAQTDDDVGEPSELRPTKRVVLSPRRGDYHDRHLRCDDGALFDNAPPEGARSIPLAVFEAEEQRLCCPDAETARLAEVRFGPAFLMGNGLPYLVERLAEPAGEAGLPCGGRRALTFSDSRQGAARLAAKLQQESERGLTRAFLYHSVQQDAGPAPARRTELEKKLIDYLSLPQSLQASFGEDIRRVQAFLAGEAKPIAWSDLISRFSEHAELRNFAGDAWSNRYRGYQMAEEPRRLAEMFLLRELVRRPKVQNNAETLGLVRLAFPDLEQAARQKGPPAALARAGVDAEGWLGIVLAGIDNVFRDSLAIDISPDWMVSLVSPRSFGLRAICRSNLEKADRPPGSRGWPSPRVLSGRPSRLVNLIFELLGSSPENDLACDDARVILETIWDLVSRRAARDVGQGAYRLDFTKAAIQRVEAAWICPVTRRIFAYSPAGRSPYDPKQQLTPIGLPRVPRANPGGLEPAVREEVALWLDESRDVAALRRAGQWTNIHDRAVSFAPFLRAQEHSAQIERPALAIYEDEFRKGRINFLNCSTTMEMGVDIPNVRMVVNANVPPSVSNYRQRVGRGGRRGEPWAFAITYCRDLPLDRAVFADPNRLLDAPIPAPLVRLDSPAVIERHVHAFLLGAFLRSGERNFNVRETVGAFLGVSDEPTKPDLADAPGLAFVAALLGDWGKIETLAAEMAYLTRGTALASRSLAEHLVETGAAFEAFHNRWRAEHTQLMARAEVADEDAKAALGLRAKRMRGEFLLGELARRGFTPAYGFPVDVVAFDHLSGSKRAETVDAPFAFGERRGGASRTLDMAIREYAPGAELVVDGLVHISEGVLPAWGSGADASGLEDLQTLWECKRCRTFGMAVSGPEVCPACSNPSLERKRALRPAGFLGRKQPHTGYERLSYVPFELPRVTARGGAWLSLPNGESGRFRADPAGEVLTTSSGPNRAGYALCLACGRAEAETVERAGSNLPLPSTIARHRPLARSAQDRLVAGYCPGGSAQPGRIQANIRFAHLARTDVFELQMPAGTASGAALALAAALREALCELLGADAREIGVAVEMSAERRVSAMLHDRASGGAGLVARLADIDWLMAALDKARQRLACPDDCETGCPACVLRPDLNFAKPPLDRRGGLALASGLEPAFTLPAVNRVFGAQTRPLGTTLTTWLENRQRIAQLTAATIWLHGAPKDWDLAAWPATAVLGRLKERGVRLSLALADAHLVDRALDMSTKLGLHQLATLADLAHVRALPRTENGAPIVVTATGPAGSLDVAALSEAEALPNEDWGSGASLPLVVGKAETRPTPPTFDTERLVTLSAGNARLIRVAGQLDGSVGDFGKRFWQLIGAEAPMVLGALTSARVREAIYVDRYLASPLTFLLMASVMTAVPGFAKTAPRVARTASFSSPSFDSTFVYHNFVDDRSRSEFLSALMPAAKLEFARRGALSHARQLLLTLTDGRQVSILLDQGFGAWKCEPLRHDFSAKAADQARRLGEQNFSVWIAEPNGSPLVVEMTA